MGDLNASCALQKVKVEFIFSKLLRVVSGRDLVGIYNVS